MHQSCYTVTEFFLSDRTKTEIYCGKTTCTKLLNMNSLITLSIKQQLLRSSYQLLSLDLTGQVVM